MLMFLEFNEKRRKVRREGKEKEKEKKILFIKTK